MSTPVLFNVLFAWKCSSTHHKLALDALRHLRGNDAERWRDFFLGRIEPFLDGSKAPDTRFKDFKNHVLHVEENHWGGAVQAAESWYAKTRTALSEGRWADAAFAAGVLSHYYSDPWQPFHTGQSEAEGVIHRAAEWSIACSYEELQQILEEDFGGYPEVDVPSGDDWLAVMIREAAATAHDYYQASIDHYDFAVGRKNPAAGFDQEAKDFLAVLLGSAVVGFARILERAIAESQATPPHTSVTLLGVVSQLTVPLFWITRKLKTTKERAAVEATYREFQARGKVIDSLSEGDATVRRQHAEEVLIKSLEELDKEPIGPLGQAYGTGTPQRPRVRSTLKGAASSQNSLSQAATAPTGKGASQADRGRRHYLSRTDLVERAPSIGPKTADRLSTVGIRTVSDLLRADAGDVARKLNAAHIDAALIKAWQSQAELACCVPGLRGHDAQILVACDVSNAEELRHSVAEDLLARVTAFLQTPSGERVLRDGRPPDLAEVRQWIAAAHSVDTAAAA